MNRNGLQHSNQNIVHTLTFATVLTYTYTETLT
jgi:hypothetical protein